MYYKSTGISEWLSVLFCLMVIKSCNLYSFVHYLNNNNTILNLK